MSVARGSRVSRLCGAKRRGVEGKDAMRKLWIFLFGFLLGSGSVWFAFTHHVVNTRDGLILVPKQQAGLADLYADVRSWKPADWKAHPQLVQSLIARGRSDVIGAAATEWLPKLGNADKDDVFRTE
jgi:hypothetical protein